MAPIHLGDLRFERKADAVHEIKATIQGYALGMPCVGKHHELASGLFLRHPQYEAKLAGRTVSHFEVRRNGPERLNRGFHAVFTDGSSVDYSYIEALKPASRRTKVLRTLRAETRDHVEGFFRANGGVPGVNEVDHEPPTFITLAEDFVSLFPQLWEDPHLDMVDAGVRGDRFSDPNVAAVWRRQHQARAVLRLVTLAEHRTITVERRASQ